MICSLIAISFVSAQSSTVGKDCPNFQPCLQEGGNYKIFTCDPLQSRNISWYNTCLCLNNINIGLCYNQCTTDSQVVSQGIAFQGAIVSSCQAVDINPKGPLPKAPWVNEVTTTSSSSVVMAPTSAASSTPSKNNGQKIMSSLAGFVLILYYL